jgi:thiol-disulfide isomerase/thioredoxin
MKGGQFALLLGAALAAGGLGLWAGARFGGGSTPQGTELVGQPAAQVALPGLDGRVRTLAEFGGRPLLINFWASWCGPCIEEMPMLDAFAAAQAGNGVQVVGIALDERAAIEAFLKSTPVRYPVLLDSAGPTDSSVRLGNVRGVLPYSVLIDAQGRIAATKTGPFRGDELGRFTSP